MKQITINLYQFNELNKEAKEKAVETFRSFVDSDNWHESTYEDAERIHVKIESFDIDYNKIEGGLSNDSIEVAIAIFEQHGKDCDTYKIADKFKERYYDPKSDIETLENNFTEDLLQEYLKILKAEYEHQTSEGAIIETIEANEYYFFSDGKLASCTTYTGKHEKAGITECKFHGQIHIIS